MERVKCECYAIRLFRTMTEAYDYWLDHPDRGVKILVNSARGIHYHLKSEFEKGNYKEKQEPYHSLLEEMQTAIRKYDEGSDSGVHAIEIVRNRIHSNDELKQLMVCGEPYVDKSSLSETARVLAEAFNAMEDTTTDDARSFLDKQYEKLSCGKK